MYVQEQHETMRGFQPLGFSPHLRRPGILGSLGDTNSDVLSQTCPSGVGKSPCNTKSVSIYTAFLQQAISSRLLPMPTQQTASTTCSGSQSTGAASATKALTVTKAGAGITAGVGSSLASAGVISATVPIVGAIVGLVAGIAGIFTAHHAQAEAEQSDLLCTLVPQVNQALQGIDQALASGQMTPAQASSQYSTILGSFTSGVKGDPSFKTGDALYGYMLALQAVIAARNDDLQNGVLTGGSPGPWVSTANPLSTLFGGTSSSGLPSWLLPVAAIGLVAVLAFR